MPLPPPDQDPVSDLLKKTGPLAEPLIVPYRGVWPQIDSSAFIAPGAVVAGDVVIGPESSIWYGCVVRGDVEKVRIGRRTNIQDGTVIHVSRHEGPTLIGDGVTVGHQALLHACILEDRSFVGMGARVLDYAVVESGAMAAAGALVAPRKRIPAGQVWAGCPATYFRDLTQAEQDFIPQSEDNYVRLSREYMEEPQ